MTGLLYGEAMGTNWLSSQKKIDEGHHYFVDGGWNKLRIVARGPRIQTWVNGNLVEDLINEAVYQSHPKGFIGLQVHGLSEREVNLHPEFGIPPKQPLLQDPARLFDSAFHLEAARFLDSAGVMHHCVSSARE